MKRNRSRDKMLPRERIDRLIDPGSSFLELSQVRLSFFFLFGSSILTTHDLIEQRFHDDMID